MLLACVGAVVAVIGCVVWKEELHKELVLFFRGDALSLHGCGCCCDRLCRLEGGVTQRTYAFFSEAELKASTLRPCSRFFFPSEGRCRVMLVVWGRILPSVGVDDLGKRLGTGGVGWGLILISGLEKAVGVAVSCACKVYK